MSGPNPPGREPDEPESEPVSDTGDERASGNHLPPVAGGGDKLPSDQTGETDAYSRAYSAPESEHVTGGPYVPADLRLYDYDDYEESSDLDDELAAPRWPWVVGVAAIIAAVALVVSVSLLVTRPRFNSAVIPLRLVVIPLGFVGLVRKSWFRGRVAR